MPCGLSRLSREDAPAVARHRGEEFKEGHPRYGGTQKGQHLSIKREAFERLRTLAVDAAGDVGYDGEGLNGCRNSYRSLKSMNHLPILSKVRDERRSVAKEPW
jgi:hypothetical protein